MVFGGLFLGEVWGLVLLLLLFIISFFFFFGGGGGRVVLFLGFTEPLEVQGMLGGFV